MRRRVVILGAGPGGYMAALAAAQKGLEVTLVEERAIGGTCLNHGCIPTKTLLVSSELYHKIREAGRYGIRVERTAPDLPAMQDRKDRVVKTLRTSLEGLLKRRGVRLVASRGHLLDSRTVQAGDARIEADSIVLATGTEPLRIWEGEGIITSDEALNQREIPDTLMVVGAGAVGVEMACIFCEIGSRVTLAEMMPQILPGIDPEIADLLCRELKKKGISIKTGCKIEKIEDRTVFLEGGEAGSYQVIIQAVGRRFNTEDLGLERVGLSAERGRIKTDLTMQTKVSGIYAIGDIAMGSPLLAHSAFAQGIVAALNIAGENGVMDYDAIPNCIYTHPEVATVGLKEDQVEGAVVGKVPYRAIGRAHAGGDVSGLIKVVSEGHTRKVKGVHIVGEKATEIIHEGALAVRAGLTIEKLARGVRAHPTFSEIYSEVFHLMEGMPLHIG